MSYEQLRRQYTLGGLREQDVDPNPLRLFDDWFRTALENAPAAWVEPYAMTLSTADSQGTVSSRIVLLRGADDRGFVFYTNYESAKGQQLGQNPHAALLFYWGYLERQVRIEGAVTTVEAGRADAYFQQRPRGSQLSAAVSPQSQVVPHREFLEEQVAALANRLGEGPVPRPEHWGGYCLVPERIEFWQGRENRLHDRLLFQRAAPHLAWKLQRLAP